MVAQRGPLLTKRAGPLRRAHTESARAGHARHAGSAFSEFWNAWSACFPRPPSGHNGPRDTTFVAGSEKVTFDVKYFGLRPQNPADEFVTGRPSEQRDCGFAKGDTLGSIMKRPLSSKNWRFIGVAARSRVLRSDCGWIIVWRGRRRGGVDVVVDHRHCRGCA